MKKWSRYTIFAVTILTVLALSAMQVVPVLADDGAPPPTETPEVVDPAAGGAVTPPEESTTPEASPETAPAATEAPAVEAPVVAEVAPTEQAPLATEVPAEVAATAPAEAAPAAADEQPAAEPQTPAEILAQVPEGTDLVVLDENGEALPLVTEEAAEIVYTGDPIWCPVGVAPKPGMGGCTTSTSSFNGAGGLLSLIAGKTVAGVIWIAYDYNSSAEGGPITLSGAPGALGSTANYALTIKGGLNLINAAGSTALNSTTPYSVFTVPLSIINWNGDVTLSDIVITGASGTGYALEVGTTKNITLTNVDVQDNSTDSGGAYLHNTGGTGNVTINDSTFSGNSGTTGLAGGLIVRSSGNVTAKNLSAYGNGAAGVDINTRSAANTLKTVTMTGSNNFSFNGGNGLTVLSRGAITLSNINAVSNDGQGAYLDNCEYTVDPQYGPYCNQYPGGAVILKGSGNFSNNGSDGLYVESSGIITAANLTANNNGLVDENGVGAYLSNYNAYPAKAVTLTGINTFNGNAGAGLWLDSWGAVILNNLTANDNGGGTNCAGDCNGAHVEDAASLLLNGYGKFSGNASVGLVAYSWGLMTLNNLYATANDWGAVLEGSFIPAINLLGTNVINDNTAGGLWIDTGGVVTLNNMTANNNGGYGVYVDNTTKRVWSASAGDYIDVLAGRAVTLKGLSTFNGNIAGLEIHSSGIITTNGITASGNDGDAVYLDNCLYDSDPSIDDCTGLAGKAVSMLGNNTFNDNLGDGLYIESLGAIKVNNLTAEYNGGVGATLDNNWTKTIGGVTITGFSSTSGNHTAGLNIYSVGAVTASNLTANDNGPDSATADQYFYRGVMIGAFGNVTLLGVNTFNNNWNTGLQIGSSGIVLLNNVTANNNGMAYADPGNPTPRGYGVYVNNSSASTPKAVTLNGVNVFNGNFDDGLYINTRGAVILSKPTANQNGDRGAYVNNQNALNVAVAPVTVTGYGIFNSNQSGTGLEVFSNGNVTLNSITANFNGGGGVSVDAQRFTRGDLTDSALPVNVTLLGVNTFNGNLAGNGLTVLADGIITLTSVTANENAGDGANLNNTTYLKTANPRNIILNGWSTFIGNTGDGLEFHASGAVTLTRITSNYNTTGTGVLGTAGTTITWTCGSLNLNNQGYNLTAGAGKVVTLKGVFSYGNTLANSAAPAAIITRTCPLP